jgi:hypothetical protein
MFQKTYPCRYTKYELIDMRNIIGTLFYAEIQEDIFKHEYINSRFVEFGLQLSRQVGIVVLI